LRAKKKPLAIGNETVVWKVKRRHPIAGKENEKFAAKEFKCFYSPTHYPHESEAMDRLKHPSCLVGI
jgi:hypothetical protein